MKRIQQIGSCIILQIALATPALVLAETRTDGVIDEPLISSSERRDSKQLIKDVKREQRELAKLNRKQLQKQAKKGERLAQIALGGDFASEAQMLVFAPIAANDAASDALAWYSLAAKRGFPGAPSLDASGVSFYPVRVVRNK